MNLIKKSKNLLACFLACLCASATAQIMGNSERRNVSTLEQENNLLLDLAKSPNSIFSLNENGQLARVKIGEEIVEVLYDLNGKIDGYRLRGKEIKVAIVIDAEGRLSLVAKEENGKTQTRVDLDSPFVLPQIKEQLTNAANFSRIEMDSGNPKADQASVTKLKNPALNIGSKPTSFADDTATLLQTPPQICLGSCNLQRSVDLNDCDFSASVRQTSCGALGAMAIELGPLAVAGVGGICLIKSASDTRSCKNQAEVNYYQCVAGC